MDASESYSWLVFTLFIASAIFLAVFVVLQWAKDGPKGHRVTSVLLLYTLLYVLLLLLSLPFDPFDAGLLAPIAVVLGSGVGLGVVLGSIISVVRGIIRWIRRLCAGERQQSQLAEAKDQSRVQVRNEEGERPSRRILRKGRDVVLALGARSIPSGNASVSEQRSGGGPTSRSGGRRRKKRSEPSWSSCEGRKRASKA